MNEEAPSPLPPPRPAPEPTKHEKRITLAWALVVIMTLATAAFAWLYFGKDKASPQPTEQTDQNDQNQPADIEDEEETGPDRTVYQAEIGKFKLEIDSKYAVIENLDGNFEGGPATELEIGNSSPTTPNVVVSSPVPFTIFAKPEAGATLSDNFKISQLEENPLASREEDVTFADTPARVYNVEGLFTMTHIVFVKNGVLYEIVSVKGDERLNDVKAGFSFVE